MHTWHFQDDPDDSDRVNDTAIERQNWPQPVMIIAASPVNRVVIIRIAERAGLKTMAPHPDAAPAALAQHTPAMVILDEDARLDSRRLLVDAIAPQRRIRHNLPFTVLLTTNVQDHGEPESEGFDAIVAKPITAEVLQPVIDDLMDRARQAAGQVL